MSQRRQQPSLFMSLVQDHEREWGTTIYDARPSLAEVISSPVVVFWQSTKKDEKRLTVSLHEDFDALQKYFFRLLLVSSSELPSRRVVRIFHNQTEQRITGFQVEFAPVNGEE